VAESLQFDCCAQAQPEPSRKTSASTQGGTAVRFLSKAMQIRAAHATCMQLLVHNTRRGVANPAEWQRSNWPRNTEIGVEAFTNQVSTRCGVAKVPCMLEGEESTHSLRIDSQRRRQAPSYRLSTVAQQLLPIMQVAAAVVCLVCC
jgi:hypothetical protein